MIVIVVVNAPLRLRGYLTRWLMEVRTGVYVGDVSTRIREHLWKTVIELIGNGEATLVHKAPGEQGFAVEAHQPEWQPVDFDGITLVCQPSKASSRVGRQGTSRAAKLREYGARGKSRRQPWSSDGGEHMRTNRTDK